MLIKVAVASHCHTGFNVARGHCATPLPCTGFSHEGAGTVVAVGTAVPHYAHRPLAVGDRVMGGMLVHPCGSCPGCAGPRETDRQYCASTAVAAAAAAGGYDGVTADGFYAEYARHTARLPDAIPLVEASPLACAGRTVWRAVLKTGLGASAGQTLAVVGSGGADAMMTVSFARESTAPACAATRMHGTVLQVSEPDVAEIPPDELVFRAIRTRGTLIASGDESRDMLGFVAEHGIRVKTTLFYGLDGIFDLVREARSSTMTGKACLVWLLIRTRSRPTPTGLVDMHIR